MVRERGWGQGAQGLAALALALAGLFPGNNPDTFGHLAQGRQIFELGEVPAFDTWSLLPGPPRPWHNYEWLSDLLFYGLYRTFGYDGLLGFKCLLLFVTGIALLSLARRFAGERGVLWGALVLVASIPAVRFRLSDRPHVLGLCLAGFYLVSFCRLLAAEGPDAQRTRRRIVGLVFALHVLWVNLHGSHLLGVAITVAFALVSPAEARRYLLCTLGLEVVASCISPYGPYIVSDAIAHVFDPRYREVVTEWAAWNERTPPWFQLGPALHAAVLALVAPRLRKHGPAARAGLLVGLMLGIACFRSVRFVAEFVLLTTPLVGAGLGLMLAEVSFSRMAAGIALSSPLVVWLVCHYATELPPFWGLGHGSSYESLPHGPGQLLARAASTPRVFASVKYAWPLMWEAPRARFFIDGRVPFYGVEHMLRSMRARDGARELDAVLRESDINAVVSDLVEGDEQALIAHMYQRPGWSMSLVDTTFVLFTRDDLAQASHFPRLEHLHPTYAPEWVLGASPAEHAAIARELDRLEPLGLSDGFSSWVRALQVLSAVKRAGEGSGFRWPEGPGDWQTYRRAATLLDRASKAQFEPPGFVFVLRALVEVTLCKLDQAEATLDHAAVDGERFTILVRQEIALRRGDVEGVRALVQAARDTPEGRNDAWLAALEGGLATPPPCPPP